MFLCMDCFKNGNHEGHEFYLIRCEDGATCGLLYYLNKLFNF